MQGFPRRLAGRRLRAPYQCLPSFMHAPQTGARILRGEREDLSLEGLATGADFSITCLLYPLSRKPVSAGKKVRRVHFFMPRNPLSYLESAAGLVERFPGPRFRQRCDERENRKRKLRGREFAILRSAIGVRRGVARVCGGGSTPDRDTQTPSVSLLST